MEDVRCVYEDCDIVGIVYALFDQRLGVEKIKIGWGAPKSIDFPQALRIAPSYEVYALKSHFFDGVSRFVLTRDRKSTRLNSSHSGESRMPSSA